jgi:hypothetical protein
MKSSGWFGVRCVFWVGADGREALYEERVTVWRACDAAEAIRLAEADARDYASDIDANYLGLAQAYTMADDLVAGAEVFSLMRTSRLNPAGYLHGYFDTGAERQVQERH